MAENSGIAWTTHTFNPWVGCTKIGPGCDRCYAEKWDGRFNGGIHWGAGAPRRRTTGTNWRKVRVWQRDRRAAIDRGESPEPVRVFCASLADVFDNEVPEEWRRDLWKLIAECPDLDWILVTKRVGNVVKMAPPSGFPPNVILISTIVSQPEADRDLDKLVALKRRGIARLIGVSYEPALGPVDWEPWLADLDWLIVGGESRQGNAEARHFRIEWGRSSIQQCSAAGVAVFMKQMGSTCIMDRADAVQPVALGAGWNAPGQDRECGIVRFRDRAGAEPIEWPRDLRIREFPVIGGSND